MLSVKELKLLCYALVDARCYAENVRDDKKDAALYEQLLSIVTTEMDMLMDDEWNIICGGETHES